MLFGLGWRLEAASPLPLLNEAVFSREVPVEFVATLRHLTTEF